MVRFNLTNEQQTLKLGEYLGSILFPGCVICLKGDLGAGKTTFTKGIAKGLGIEEPVTSPTFTIINQYEGKNILYHIDTYRMDTLQDMIDLGVEEYLPALDGITVVEWPELIEDILPSDRLIINLIHGGEDLREISITAVGSEPKHQFIIQELKKYENTRS